MEDYRLEQTGQEVQRILNGAAMDANLQAEVERATDAEGTLQENIDAEAQARQDADGLLQQGIDDEAQRAKDAEEANAGEIEGIKALIPSTASEGNKLADTNYVNSSIQTATAEYRGDYNVVTDLHLAIDATHAQIETLLPTVIAEADKNDYCYVMIPTNASTPTEIAKIERYKMTSEGWKFEYDVNNSTFTAEEWAAIKSGITSGLVAKLNALPTNADLLLLLAGKQDVLTFDSVPVPESNNPVKSGGVYSAIDDEKTARLNSDTAIHAELDGLQAKVPATASSDNKLVDQNQMNSSISTATATFRGDWNVVSDLHLAVDATRAQIAAMLPTVISTADNNDYCYVEIPTSAETPTQIASVERYKFNGTAWAFEYVLNNSGFTAAQWAAINSMITSGLVAKLSALPTNADLLAMLAQKQDVLTFDSTPTENSTNPVTSGGVFAADKALSDAIEAILLLIPSAASALNKLVDTSLMNSSISTATATFRGTYNLVSNLGLGIDATEGQIAAALSTAISTADNNDYAFVQIPTSAQTPTQIARTDRYKFNGTAWAFEYTLNTSGFTAAQWAAINSTITSALVAKLNALPTAAELQEVLGTLTSGITAINQKIPSTASQSNNLVDNASMESYIAQVINTLDATFNITSTDGHITLHITQVDGVITSVQVQSTDIASAADLALKASQADLTALASRVTTAEGNITSLTGRMGTAETNIANLQQLYNNLQQSKPVPVTALPSTGQQQGVIYRLAGTTSYSDYMWNGSTWVLMATYNNAIDPRPKKASQNLVTSGGVFDNMGALDVSELNATENPHTLAQYADLSAALAAIPTDYQKGGMSVKFIQSSDNKYVQYYLTKDAWSTLENDWEKIILEKESLIPVGDASIARQLSSFRLQDNPDSYFDGSSTTDVIFFSVGANKKFKVTGICNTTSMACAIFSATGGAATYKNLLPIVTGHGAFEVYGETTNTLQYVAITVDKNTTYSCEFLEDINPLVQDLNNSVKEINQELIVPIDDAPIARQLSSFKMQDDSSNYFVSSTTTDVIFFNVGANKKFKVSGTCGITAMACALFSGTSGNLTYQKLLSSTGEGAFTIYGETTSTLQYVAITINKSSIYSCQIVDDIDDAFEILSKKTANIRPIVLVKTTDTEIQILNKFIVAFNKGNCDVIFEHGTYTFSDVYLYMRDTLGWTWTMELPIGSNCRYFFNNSTLISNTPSETFNDSRNILGCKAGEWNKMSFELYDGILINNSGTYCVHDECARSSEAYVHKYENMKMILNTGAEALSKCIGGGAGADALIIIENCIFENNNTLSSTTEDVSWHGINGTANCNLRFFISQNYFSRKFRVDGDFKSGDSVSVKYNGNSADDAPVITQDATTTDVYIFNNEIR